MNTLLIIGLVLFASVIIWVYILFVTNTIDNTSKKQTKEEYNFENALEKCKNLYNQGLHSELQRYAQKALTKNYGNIELRRILANSLMETGNEKLAIMHYDAIINIMPSDTQTLELLASYYFENGPKQRAAEIYEQILYYDKGNIQAVEQLVKIYEDLNNYDNAIELYQTLIEAEIDENALNELEYKLANLYMEMQDYSRAYEQYQKINQKSEDNLEIMIILADLAYKNKYWQDCLKYYQKIVDIAGEDFEILEKIAQIHVTLENWEQAIQLYKKLISMENSESQNYLFHQNELCVAMMKNQQYEEAVEMLENLVAQNPKETSFIFSLARAYACTGKYHEGIKLYDKLLDELPVEQNQIIINHISNLICNWACDLFKEGKYNQAFDKFFDALKYNEENDVVYYELGRCNYQIKSFQDSIAHFKRAISIKPQESKYYFGLGCAYDEMGANKNAKAAFSDAINIDPLNIRARIAYAITLTQEFEYAQAVEQFTEILKYVPDNADTMYNLALAYEMVGDTERAIKYYQEALDAMPQHKEAKNNLYLLTEEEYIPQQKENQLNSKETTEETPEVDFEVPKDTTKEIDINKSMF